MDRIRLFTGVLQRFKSTRPTISRKLYTDHIYPYPFSYFNTKVYPSQLCYRETYPPAPWSNRHALYYLWGMRFFWTSLFYQLFWNPDVLTGHDPDVDPSKWTDAELGIPPDEEGPYADWLGKRVASQENGTI